MKKIHRFLVSTHIPVGIWECTEAGLIHHIVDVLKLLPGEEIILFEDGATETLARIQSIQKGVVIFETIETSPVAQPHRTILAAVSILKSDNFETVVQKLTELGVSEILPLITDRTIKTSVRLDRLQKISNEALEQCGGTKRVIIHEPIPLGECLKKYSYPSIVFDTGEVAPQEALADKSTYVLYVGPEGGWSEAEQALFRSHNIPSRSLGSRVLRADTAAIVGAYELLK